MKIFLCDYIPHTKEDKPEVISYYIAYLTRAEGEAYMKHQNAGGELDVEYLNHLMSIGVEDEDDRYYDEDIYYYLTEGVDKATEISYPGYPIVQHSGVPSAGDVYRGLVYHDDIAIVIKEVFDNGV